MYKSFPKAWILSGVSYFTASLFFIVLFLNQWLPGHEVSLKSIPSLVVFLLPAISSFLWRPIWKLFPKLNEWVYPDLNGEWDVTLKSNWSRQRQLLDSAKGLTAKIDFEKCDDEELAGLLEVKLKAKITMTIFTFDMKLWNPADNSPIKESDIVSAMPFRVSEYKRSGIYYIFQQINKNQKLGDSKTFYGAAHVEYHKESDTLEGLFWSERMWERAVNTAGKVEFKRSEL